MLRVHWCGVRHISASGLAENGCWKPFFAENSRKIAHFGPLTGSMMFGGKGVLGERPPLDSDHAKCLVGVNKDNFFQFNNTNTRGHPYKLYKPFSHCRARTSFFSIRVVNVLNISQMTLLTSGHYSHLRGPLVLWTCPNTSVIHIHNLSSYFCLLICLYSCVKWPLPLIYY